MAKTRGRALPPGVLDEVPTLGLDKEQGKAGQVIEDVEAEQWWWRLQIHGIDGSIISITRCAGLPPSTATSTSNTTTNITDSPSASPNRRKRRKTEVGECKGDGDGDGVDIGEGTGSGCPCSCHTLARSGGRERTERNQAGLHCRPLQGELCLPGFVDIHTHGIGGAEDVADFWKNPGKVLPTAFCTTAL